MFEESDLKNLNSCSQSSLAFDLTAVQNLTSFKAGGRSFILRPSTQQCKLFQQVHPVLYNVHKAHTKDKQDAQVHNATEHFTPESDPSVRPSVASRPAPRVEDGSGQCEGSTEVVAGKLKQLSGEKTSCGIRLE